MRWLSSSAYATRVVSWRGLIAWVLGCFALLLGVAIAAGFSLRLVERSDGSTRLDSRITQRLVTHRTDGLTSAAKAISRVGSTSVLLPVVVIAVGVLLWRRRLGLAGLVAVAWAGAIGLYDLTKPIVDRPRPPASVRMSSAAGASFPSGHATQSLATYAALAIVVAVVWQRARLGAWVVAGIIAFAVGWSRVYLGMHWATDVAAGWFIGGAWIALLAVAMRQPQKGAGIVKTDRSDSS